MLGLVAAILGPAIVLVGMGVYAVVNRKHGHWRVYAPQRDGLWKVLGKAMLMKMWLERDRQDGAGYQPIPTGGKPKPPPRTR
jgi:hypothetical protein